MDNNENIGALSTFAINVVQKNALNVVAFKNGRVDLPITEFTPARSFLILLHFE
jgi:hypothetical protein